MSRKEYQENNMLNFYFLVALVAKYFYVLGMVYWINKSLKRERYINNAY